MAFLEKLLRSKALVTAAIVLPGLWPAWPLLRQDPSVLADPLKYVLHHLGFMACVLLVVVLAFTPLRVLFPKWGIALALNRHRRLVGVSAFVYAALHFATHLLYEGGFHVLASDVTKPFLISGLLAFSILLVLAVTSLHAAVRWLGGRRWKNLHRFVYLAAALAAYHQIYAQKVFPIQVVWLFGPLLALEAARVVRQRIVKRT
ncbi:MAG TPA: ferric reductase-like transmembrane domain-containing protein [Opitutaceae bacterium]|nr:ferric reductase-like transmembrane domain-containing protein [Opitutaceae bacterium]